MALHVLGYCGTGIQLTPQSRVHALKVLIRTDAEHLCHFTIATVFPMGTLSGSLSVSGQSFSLHWGHIQWARAGQTSVTCGTQSRTVQKSQWRQCSSIGAEGGVREGEGALGTAVWGAAVSGGLEGSVRGGGAAAWAEGAGGEHQCFGSHSLREAELACS